MRVSVVPAQVTTVEDRIIGLSWFYANPYFSECHIMWGWGVCRVAANDG